MVRTKRRSALPGFGLTMGMTIFWLGLVVLVPLSALVIRAAGMGWDGFAEVGCRRARWPPIA